MKRHIAAHGKNLIAETFSEDNEKGQAFIEYVMVLVLVVLTIVAIYNFTPIGDVIRGALDNLASTIG